MLMLPSCTEQINFPPPTITSLSPTSIAAGSPQAFLTINGTNLIQQTQAQFSITPNTVAGGLITFNFISTNQIVVALPASLLQNPQTIYISVATPQPGGGTFPPTNRPPPAFTIFTITPTNSGIPQVTSINPSNTVAGNPNGVLLNVTGKNFVTLSTAFVNGASRGTTFNSPTSLTVQLTPADVVNPGAVQISIVNPSPGGGNSTPVSLSVNTPVPSISQVSPISLLAGSVGQNLTITGTGFLNQYSFITVNGQSVPTTISGSTSAIATLTAASLLPGGVNQIQAVNKAPGGGISNIMTFAVNPTVTPTPLGFPVLLDVAADGSQAINGICGGQANCQSGALGLTTGTSGPSISGTGAFVAFASASHNLVLTDLNPAADIYIRKTCIAAATCTPITAVVTTDPNGNAANGGSSEPSIDSGGVHVAFTSMATNLVTTVGVPNGTSQVYWRPACVPTATGSCVINPASAFDTQLVSMSADGSSAGNGPSFNPIISPDGQYVAFVSLATNLVSNITPDGVTPQVYVHDTCNISTIITTTTGATCVPTTYLVSTPDGVTGGNGPSSNPAISVDGLFVTFTSTASNLGATAPNPASSQEIFERSTCITTINTTTNVCTPLTTLVSTPDGTTPADGSSGQSTVASCGSSTTVTSAACTSNTVFNGRFVAFVSTATNLVTGVGPSQQIYVRDNCAGVSVLTVNCTPSTTLVSTPDGVTPANGLSENPRLSSAGELVAFSSFASNLGNTLNGVENIFVRATCLGVAASCTTATSVASLPAGVNASPANGASVMPSISADGHTVAFLSSATNLVPRDTNALEDVFLGTTTF
jgi:hypothetical protein